MHNHHRRFGLALFAFFAFLYLPERWLDFAKKRPYFSDEELKEIAFSFSAPSLIVFEEKDYKLAELGQKIFFDTRFSKNEAVACASCHIPALHFTDRIATAEGIGVGHRNTPALINLAWKKWFFWDGRADSLEAQALQPMEAALEHGISRGRIVQLIWQHYREEYEKLFEPFSQEFSDYLDQLADSEWHAIPKPLNSEDVDVDVSLASYGVATISSFRIQTQLINEAHRRNVNPQNWFMKIALDSDSPPDEWVKQYDALPEQLQEELNQIVWNVGRSLAVFQRGITALDSAFDHFLERLRASDSIEEAFHEQFAENEWQGFKLFVQADCASCHNGPLLTDQEFHNIGLAQRGTELDLGRAIGAIRAKYDRFNCGFTREADEEMSEACLELEYIDYASPETVGAFKTPSLRNIGHTAPYMHDGRFASLDEVLDHYNKLDVKPAIGHREETLRPLNLSRGELASLKAFLLSLDSPVTSYFEQKKQETAQKMQNKK